MRLETVYGEDRAEWGKPLAGLRILAAEHMLSLPYGTQLLAVLGAEVIKVEPPAGEGGRAARPIVPEPGGTTVGGTFARSNLNKSSIVLDLKNPEGRALFLRLAGEVDVVAENMRPGVMDRLGLGYADVAKVAPRAIYLSVSGFGNHTPSPYRSWPAYAPVVEAMAGLPEIAREPGDPPRTGVAGALGDLSAGLFAVIGLLAAVRHREVTGLGQQVDVSMFDAMIAMNDMYPQLWSLGLPARMATGHGVGIMTTFEAADGYFLMAVIREHQLAGLAELLGRPEWLDDPRLSDRLAWTAHIEDIFRPAIEEWARRRTRLQAVEEMAAAGIPAGPCFTMDDLAADEHVREHNMLVEIPTGTERPVLMPGNPIKMSRVSEGPLHRHPDVGQDTEQVLTRLLGFTEPDIAKLRESGALG
ncbi:CoA transferase [Streptosporangium sp. NBC_01755]|uniref:CaiB/BaiF CoA transferase family protein n=1 Tax=unclassified Streptosporangium TaxID=2632669 RepID=UPI002DD7EEB7|nr:MULTISPECIES: CoA transferase [unclassified Streptosporangium]WSA24621.1 CoA transferase [Streptosporangium sp. NBC_01810]WSC97303.1 CoA transferase [Streptosporangium sp. NBC_01755]